MKSTHRNRMIIVFECILMFLLVGCARSMDADYTVRNPFGYDPEWGDVLFLYPNVEIDDAVCLPDPPAVVFDHLSDISRFVDWHQGDRIEEDVVFLEGYYAPIAITYLGVCTEMMRWNDWHAYSIRQSTLSYFTEISIGFGYLVYRIPFPNYLLGYSQSVHPVVVPESNEVFLVDFAQVAAFYRLFEYETIDEEAGIITFQIIDDEVVFEIRDLGDGSVRITKWEETS